MQQTQLSPFGCWEEGVAWHLKVQMNHKVGEVEKHHPKKCPMGSQRACHIHNILSGPWRPFHLVLSSSKYEELLAQIVGAWHWVSIVMVLLGQKKTVKETPDLQLV